MRLNQLKLNFVQQDTEMNMKLAVMILLTGFGFGALMVATECRPMMPVVQYMIWAGGGEG